jgi:predicted transcriptional regulator
VPSTTVRISEEIRESLRDLAAKSGETMQEVLEHAVLEYRKKRFFDEVSAAYEAMRADPEAWREELAERKTLDGTLADDLDAE